MKELRNGYFDPIYNKPENVGKVDSNEVKDGFNFKISLNLKFRALRFLNSYLQNWKILTKFSIAYFISFALCLITTTGDWLGDNRMFLPLAVLIHHPVHSVGVQFEMTVQSIIGLATGLAWSSLALFISVSTQPTRNHQGGILAGSLFIGLFLMGWFKGYMIRLYYLLLTSGLVLIYLSTCLILDDPTVHWKNCWNIAIPYLFGVLISLVVSLCYFPVLGPQRLMESILENTNSIKELLITFTQMDTMPNKEEIVKLQNTMVNHTLLLSENFREFLSGLKLSRFDQEDLKRIRNHLNLVVSPLRVIPFQSNLYFKDVSTDDQTPLTSNSRGPNSTLISNNPSGVATPVPRSQVPSSLYFHPKINQGKEFVYVFIMNERFASPMMKPLSQMIECISESESLLSIFMDSSSSKEIKQRALTSLNNSKHVLKRKIHQLDITYRKFSKSEYFCHALLEQEQVINIFLFLRYARQASVGLISLSEAITKACENSSVFNRPSWPNYPLKRSLRRLPEQCLRDQGADSIFHYLESKFDVDDAFERIYNLNTSRNNQHHHQFDHDDDDSDKKKTRTIRAIDRNDFNFQSTKNKYRFKLWALTKILGDYQTKYAFKISVCVLFLSLPSWLQGSWTWYYRYNCYWCPLVLYFLLSPRNSNTWNNLFLRVTSWLVGSFWAWAANEAGKSSHTVVIGIFAAIFVFFFAHFFLIDAHPRSGLIGLLSFTIVSLSTFIGTGGSNEGIWKHSWITSLSIFVAILTSVLSNWLVWPFVAKNEIYNSCSSLLSHIGQSYQSVSERYLYRDENDDPTDLTLELANIREIRMSQNLVANEELLERAIKEHDITHSFKSTALKDLLNSCHVILENLIEARMSSIYFHIWEQDEDERTTRELLSLRRDSISTVIYILYMLSNSVRTRTKIPRYLPSAISVRKKLYDLISELELSKQENRYANENIAEQLNKKLSEVQIKGSKSNEDTEDENDEKSYMKMHWREVHGMAFARAFTSITGEVENIVMICKELVGEEGLLD
jgi:hypothetical protein